MQCICILAVSGIGRETIFIDNNTNAIDTCILITYIKLLEIPHLVSGTLVQFKGKTNRITQYADMLWKYNLHPSINRYL